MNDLTPSNEYAGFERYAQEASGLILKFTKNGEWVAGTSEEQHTGATMVADVPDLAVGSRKWKDSKIVDMDVGFVRDNFRPKERSELDDNDPASWPKNTRGEPNDPWQYAFYLRLTDEDGTLYTWTASSKGAMRAINDLCRQYLRKRVNPIVELGSSSYKHREYGKINSPVLKIVGWADDEPDKPALPAPQPTPKSAPDQRPFAPIEAIDDSIPF
jgi:hypothetical protein